MERVVSLVVFLTLSFGTAAFASRFRPGIWYEELAKPWFTPPDWLFAPVWGVLYLAIAVAGWLVWRASEGWTLTLVWLSQLTLNGAWSWLFFGLHRPGWALAEITLLKLAILLTIILFFPVSRTASLLLVPYWIWVAFALALNLAIWRLNP